MPVTDVSAVAGNNEVILAWAEADDSVATAYVVQVTPDERLMRITAPVDGATVSGLRNGVEYAFTVYSVSEDGSSGPSRQVRATPTNGMDGEIAGLIVGFEPTTSVSDGQAEVPGETLVDEVGLTVNSEIADGMHTIDFTESVSLEQAKTIAAELTADPRVAWAEPDQFVFTSALDGGAAPNDPQFLADQWNLWDAYGVGLGDTAGKMSRFYSLAAGRGATVAVIDTGVTAHPDLDSNLVPGFDFVSDPPSLAAPRVEGGPDVPFDGDADSGWDANPNDPGDWRGVAPVRDSSWHGTYIAGVIAAQANNMLGVVGINPGARVQPIRALSWRGGLLSDIAASITWASGGHVDGVPDNANPTDVINMSFSVNAACSVALQTAITAAHQRGSVLVAAAGNANADVKDYAPANCADVIAVGATARDGLRASYSNFGSGIDISAPGGSGTGASGVLSTVNAGLTVAAAAGYGAKEGTSVAAAHVSAAAAWDFARVYELFPVLRERKLQPAGTLSGGEQQMLAVGRAMMTKPKLLLLDEPSLGLAPLIVARIFQVIQTLNQQGVTILLVEQNARMALKIAHRAYVLETGEVTMAGPAADVLADPRVAAAYLGE